jgi:hypothetical protein
MAILAGVAVAVLLVAAHAQAEVAYNCPALMVGADNLGFPYMIGNAFTVNSAINVTAVGAFENGASGGSGLGGGVTVPVAIYSYNAGAGTWNIVSDTSKSFSATAGTAIGNARFLNLTPVTLNPGTYAIVAANYGEQTSPTFFWSSGNAPAGSPPPTFTTSSAIKMGAFDNSNNLLYHAFYTGGVSNLQSSFSGVTDLPPFTSPPDWVAGTFEFDLSPVPEAATFGAAGVGLLALVYIGRYARLRSKVTPA